MPEDEEEDLLPAQAESAMSEDAKARGQTKAVNLETIRFSMIFP